MASSSLCDDLRTLVSFVVVRRSQNEAVGYLDNGLTSNHKILRGPSHGPVVNNYFRPEVIAKKTSKMPSPTASGGIS